jgi:hypothetical protein
MSITHGISISQDGVSRGLKNARRPGVILMVVGALDAMLMAAATPFRSTFGTETGGQFTAEGSTFSIFWLALAVWSLILGIGCVSAAVLFVWGRVRLSRDLMRAVAILGVLPNVVLGIIAFAAWKLSAADEDGPQR